MKYYPFMIAATKKLPTTQVEKMNTLFLRHGLLLLLALLLAFTFLPFAAPVAMNIGWEFGGELLYRFYGLFCHQLPQRSWFLFGPNLTYTLAELQQVNPGLSPLELRGFVGEPMMGWKAGDHFGTFNWWARLLTGALAAWGIAFTVVPLLDQIMQQEVSHAISQE